MERLRDTFPPCSDPVQQDKTGLDAIWLGKSDQASVHFSQTL